jgi:hypothetical protein
VENGKAKQEEGVEQEREIKKEEESATVSDDNNEDKKLAAAKRNKTDKERVVDGYAYEGMRVAKYFEVQGQTELTLYFGRVATYYASSGGDDPDSWEIQYDDGGEGEFGLEELEKCLELARENRHLDAARKVKKKSKSQRKSSSDVDSDDSSVEDVTDQVIRDRKTQLEQNTIDISGRESDDNGESSDDDDDDEDYESDADDLSYADDDSFDGDKKRKAKNSLFKSGKRACKPKEPPLEVVMQPKDVPAAPGKRDTEQDNTIEQDDGLQEASTLSGSAGAEQAVKDRIMKLLNTGFHENSNENEAKNAMKLAQRLMKRHNLKQAVLLKERDANGGSGDQVLKGGLVEVKIINRKTRKPSQFARWLAELMKPISKNFEVESYYTVSRGHECAVTFYGIYTNCQLAGYAYHVAAERISQMAAEHKPTKHFWRNISTKSSRLSYALGIVRGIDNEVEVTMQREKEKMERKLERARLAASKGEAYEESDDEDDDDIDGPAFSLVDHGDGGDASGNEDDKKPTAVAAATSTSSGEGIPKPKMNDHSTQSSPPARMSSISGETLERRVKEMEKEQENSLVLVDHSKKVAKEVLEERNIKVRKGAKRKPITFDRTSYDKGVEDSKEIDINQRAIRDEVKVKKEER